jgi:hypothetical protein
MFVTRATRAGRARTALAALVTAATALVAAAPAQAAEATRGTRSGPHSTRWTSLACPTPPSKKATLTSAFAGSRAPPMAISNDIFHRVMTRVAERHLIRPNRM